MDINDIFAKYINPASLDSTKMNNALCKECGGSCCKAMGCHISPFDLKEISVQSIIDFIDESMCISLDWWVGSPIDNDNNSDSRGLFLRIKNQHAKVIDPSWGDVCSLLTDNGCPLLFEYRPKGARELVAIEGDCACLYSKKQCATEWYEYRDILFQVYDYYDKKGEVTMNHYMDAISQLLLSIEHDS